MTPKERFLKLPAAKTFADMSASEPFQTAMDYALLEMQSSRAGSIEPAAEHFMQRGAVEFRRILESLATPYVEQKQVRTPTLNHDAYNRPTRAS
jgi:hypothetical protein